MTKGTKTFLIVCAAVVGIGLIFSIAGFALGGMKGLGSIENKIPWVNLGGSGEAKSQSYTFEKFSSLDIQSDIGKIEFIQGDQYKVDVTYDEKYGAPVVENTNDKLTVVSQEKRRGWLNLGFLGHRDYTGTTIKVYYPKSVQFSDVKVVSDLGDIKLSDLNAKRLEIGADAGNVSLNHITAEMLDINVDLGNAEGTNVVTKGMNAKVDAGRLDLTGAFAGITKVNCDLGDCNLTTSIPKNKYSINASVDLGSCTIDGNSVGDYTENNGSAANQLDITCSAGSIAVDFR